MEPDLRSLLSEIAALTRGACPSTASPIPLNYQIGLPSGATTKFSLPAHCYWTVLSSTAAFGVMFSSAASSTAIPVAANTALQLFGPLNLSTVHLHCLAAASGATVSAWVQKSSLI